MRPHFQNHIGAIAQHGDRAELVEICDTNPRRCRLPRAATRARPFSSLSDMLAQGNADALVLATPSGLHPWQAIEVAQAGRHVVSEKPMATRWEDGKRMVKACDEAGVRLFVVKQNRRNATLQLVKKAIEQGRFGRIYMVTVNVFWTRPQEYYDAARWRGKWEWDGGAFMNQASHYVDLLDWLVGPVESVYAYTATLARRIEAEDTGVAALRWRHGAMGSINVTMLTYPQNLEGSITILGERGRFAWAALRSTASTNGSLPNRIRMTTRSAKPITKPRRSTVSGTRCTTTMSSIACAATANPKPTAAKACNRWPC